MKDSRLEKLAPLTGVVFVVLMAIGTLLIGAYDYLPSADRAVEILSGNPGNVSLGGYIGTVSAFFLMWFAGSVYSALREREGGAGRLSMVAFGGGVATGVGIAAGFSVIMAAGLRAGTEVGISSVGAVTLIDLWGQVTAVLGAISMAVFIGATAVVTLRTAVFPTWFGWVSVLIAIGLLTPIAYIVLGIAMLWLLLVSIWLFRRGRSTG